MGVLYDPRDTVSHRKEKNTRPLWEILVLFPGVFAGFMPGGGK